MGHYTRWLLIPAILGIPLQLYVFAANDYNSAALPAFSFILSMWSIVMLEFWKRRESMTSMSWGMAGYEEAERDRPGERDCFGAYSLNIRTIAHLSALILW